MNKDPSFFSVQTSRRTSDSSYEYQETQYSCFHSATGDLIINFSMKLQIIIILTKIFLLPSILPKFYYTKTWNTSTLNFIGISVGVMANQCSNHFYEPWCGLHRQPPGQDENNKNMSHSGTRTKMSHPSKSPKVTFIQTGQKGKKIEIWHQNPTFS